MTTNDWESKKGKKIMLKKKTASNKEKNVKGCVENQISGHAALKIDIRTYVTSKCSRKSVVTIAGTVKNVSNAVQQIRKEVAVNYMSV